MVSGRPHWLKILLARWVAVCGLLLLSAIPSTKENGENQGFRIRTIKVRREIIYIISSMFPKRGLLSMRLQRYGDLFVVILAVVVIIIIQYQKQQLLHSLIFFLVVLYICNGSGQLIHKTQEVYLMQVLGKPDRPLTPTTSSIPTPWTHWRLLEVCTPWWMLVLCL